MTKRPFPVIPRKLRIIALIAAILGPVAAIVCFYDYYRDARLLQIGTRVAGAIQSFRAEPSTKGREIYKFEVTWRDPEINTKYIKNFSTSSTRWPGGAPQDRVTVIYDRQNPQHSEIGDDFRPDSEPIALGMCMAALGLTAILWLRYSSKKNLGWLEKELEGLHPSGSSNPNAAQARED